MASIMIKPHRIMREDVGEAERVAQRPHAQLRHAVCRTDGEGGAASTALSIQVHADACLDQAGTVRHQR